METKAIYQYLKELSRCEYNPNIPRVLEEFTYNGITYAQGAETYANVMKNLEAEFKSQILELSSSAQFSVVVGSILSDFKAQVGAYYDIPDDETIYAMERDYVSSNNKSLLQSIREAKFLQEMNGVQKFYLEVAITFMSQLTGNQTKGVGVGVQEEIENEVAEPKKNESEYIRGVKGLAEYLGCSITKAQAIVNSKVLENAKPRIQQYVGGWQFHIARLEEFRDKNPEFIRKIKCPH